MLFCFLILASTLWSRYPVSQGGVSWSQHDFFFDVPALQLVDKISLLPSQIMGRVSLHHCTTVWRLETDYCLVCFLLNLAYQKAVLAMCCTKLFSVGSAAEPQLLFRGSMVRNMFFRNVKAKTRLGNLERLRKICIWYVIRVIWCGHIWRCRSETIFNIQISILDLDSDTLQQPD